MVSASSPSPGVSVVIPAYNYAQYLPRTINSVLSQTYPRVEVIVVDDGSTDSTREAVAEFGSDVRYIYQENAGLSAARNTGTEAAQFDFVAYLDADDLFRPEMISVLMAQYAELPDAFCLVACRNSLIDDDDQPVEQHRRDILPAREVRTVDILVKNRFVADAVIVKRQSILDCGGFDTSLRSTEDRDMWIRLSACGRLWMIPDELVQVRVHPGSMSTHAERMKNNGRTVLEKALKSPQLKEAGPLLRNRVFSFHEFQCAWMFYDEKRCARATIEILKSLFRYPYHSRHSTLNEPILFRLRALRRFLWHGVTRRHR